MPDYVLRGITQTLKDSSRDENKIKEGKRNQELVQRVFGTFEFGLGSYKKQYYFVGWRTEPQEGYLGYKSSVCT